MSRADFLRCRDGNSVHESTELDDSLDEILRLLSNHNRRVALYILSESEQDGIFVVDLAQKVALADGTADEIETVLAELTHAHLPQIAAAGVVEYDDDSNMVRYTGGDHVEQLLDCTKQFEL